MKIKTESLRAHFEEFRQVETDLATAQSEIIKAAKEREALLQTGDTSTKAIQQAGGISLRVSVFTDKQAILNRKAEGLKVLMAAEIKKIREQIASAVVAYRDKAEDEIAARLKPFCGEDDDLPARQAAQMRQQSIPIFHQLSKLLPTGDHFNRPTKATIFAAAEHVLNHAAKVEEFFGVKKF